MDHVWIAQHGFSHEGSSIILVMPDDETKALARFARYIKRAEARKYEGPESIWKSLTGGYMFNNDLEWFSLNRHPVGYGEE